MQLGERRTKGKVLLWKQNTLEKLLSIEKLELSTKTQKP